MISNLEEAKDMAHQVLTHAQDGDDEAAHVAEDRLRQEVLWWVMRHPGDFRCTEMCAIALSTERIEFARHCA